MLSMVIDVNLGSPRNNDNNYATYIIAFFLGLTLSRIILA
jgi:hypothetical protein